jgi:hypothetical protein
VYVNRHSLRNRKEFRPYLKKSMGKLTTKYCKTRSEVDRVYTQVSTVNDLGFLNIAPIETNEVSYSFRVFDLNGDTLLFVGFYFSENDHGV